MKFMKVKLLIKQGMSAEEAYRKVFEEVIRENIGMDMKLAECIECMKLEDIQRIFPFHE